MGFSSAQIAQASLAMQVGGAATSAISAYNSASLQKVNAQGAADLASINARISELGAQSQLAKGQQDVGNLTMKAGQIKSTQRAAMAANGVDLGEGSAVEVQASTDIMKEIDSNTLTANAVRSAWGYRTQAMNYENDARIKRATAGAISPFAAASGSLLTNAGSVAESWYKYNKVKDAA